MSDLIHADDRQLIAGLQLLARQVVEGLCGGIHQSPHKGVSVEFKQHRPYVAGDEIRHLDWRVYGKTDRFYIREYEEETNLKATLLVDCSGSMAFEGTSFPAGQAITKLEYARRLAACFAYLMLGQQDSVSLATIDERLREFVPGRSTANHLTTLSEVLVRMQAGGDGDLGGVLSNLTAKLGRRGLVVVISDFFTDLAALRDGLAQLRHRNHEVILFQIWDRDELEFPYDRWTRFDCLEIAGRSQLLDPSHARNEYLKNLQLFRDELQTICDRCRIDLVSLVSDEPCGKGLSSYLVSRSRKRRR